MISNPPILLLASVGLIQEKTLQLAADNAKGDFSRQLIDLAWRRLFWSRNYVEKVHLRRPQSELDYSWNKHLDTVADWSAEYMVNVNGMEKFIRIQRKELSSKRFMRSF